jgi:vancomycin resistance protein VanW
MNWKHAIPASWRLQWVVWRRSWRDWRSGRLKNFVHPAQKSLPVIRFQHRTTLQQPIMPGAYFENKVKNLRNAIDYINGVEIKPGAIFSFWRLVKRPTAAGGYLPGRNLVNGVVQASIGGGLCQLASIIYHNALQCGMKILEHHHHSVDIYREEERFTPLGADATVVYGYKDLRFQNPYPYSLYLLLELKNDQLHCILAASAPIPTKQIAFERHLQAGGERVEVYDVHEKRLLKTQFYKKG